MALKVQCESCGKVYRVRDELAGKKLKCKSCGHALQVPDRPNRSPAEAEGKVPTVTEEDMLKWLDAEDGSTTREAQPEPAHIPRRGYKYLEVKHASDVAVVTVTARSLSTYRQDRALNELFSLADRDAHHRILLNFSHIAHIDGQAFIKIKQLDTKLNALGGKLRLCNLSPALRALFEAREADHVFDLYNNEDAALDAFSDR